MNYLIDTSVWIPAIRKDGPEVLKEQIWKWVQENLISINGIIRIELIGGCKSQEEVEQLSDRLKGLNSLPLTDDLLEEAAFSDFTLRRKGISVPLGDLLIATSARLSNHTLVHADSHFDAISSIIPFQTISYLDPINAWRRGKGL